MSAKENKFSEMFYEAKSELAKNKDDLVKRAKQIVDDNLKRYEEIMIEEKKKQEEER